jgi:hypothetical protein
MTTPHTHNGGITLDMVRAAQATLARMEAAKKARKQVALDARTPDQVAADNAAKQARSSKTTPTQLDELANHPDGKVRLAVARNKNTPAAALTRLAADPDPTLRAAVAKHTNTTTPTLNQLVGDAHMRVLSAIAGNPATPPAVLHRIVVERPEAKNACQTIAASGKAAPDTFALLAQHPNADVRHALAVNNHATPEALRTVAFDPRTESNALYYLAQRETLPDDVINHLATHPETYIRRTLTLCHPNLSDEQKALITLAGGVTAPLFS